jgi:hypothetical protein
MSGAAGGDRLGRRPVYVRGRPAGGAWISQARSEFLPTWAKFTPSTMIVTRPCWGECVFAPVGKADAGDVPAALAAGGGTDVRTPGQSAGRLARAPS